MYKKANPVTRLCTSDVDNIWIRGRNLCDELIGHMSFTDYIMFHFFGTEPTPLQRAVVDAVLVCIMEHGMTPSAVASRVTYLGAPESLQGAVAAGLLGAGSRFVGTADEAAALITQIVERTPDERAGEARRIAERHVAQKKFLPGFGHPIHTNGDPRVKRLDEVARAAGARGEYIDAMYLLGEAIKTASGKNIVINANAAIGAVLLEAGIPPKIARGFNLIARCAGLVGHLLEEQEEPAGYSIWHAAEQAVPYEAP
ncbi:MAG: citryl-CoA lyase [Gammaproteobacteria bacterium]|nr:citryl-CoA lyase [Gammaproteobacteria bacterium]MCP5200229.1 citryl-CoA lyase [Gammaproteobacteria bacterium]